LEDHSCHATCDHHESKGHKDQRNADTIPKKPEAHLLAKKATGVKNLPGEEHVYASSFNPDHMYLNLFLGTMSLGSAYKGWTSESRTPSKYLWWGTSALFYTCQLLESFTSTTYDCLDHVTDSSHAVDELNALKKKAPRVDISITNFHWVSRRDYNGNYTTTKVVTGGESREFSIKNWTDASGDPGFLKDCESHVHKEKPKDMTRLLIKRNIKFS